MQCAALQGRLSTTSVFHFGQRQTRPKRDSVLQFGCFSKVSTSKQSNQIEAIGYGIASIWTSPSKIYKNTALLWGLLINYDNFSGNWQELCTYVPKCVKKQCVFKFVLFKTARRVQQGWFQTEAGFSDISGNTFYLCVPGYIYICIYTCINVYTSIYLCSGLIVCPPWWIQIKWGRGRTILPKTSFHTKNMFQKVSSPFALAGSLVH